MPYVTDMRNCSWRGEKNCNDFDTDTDSAQVFVTEILPAEIYVDDDFDETTPGWQITHFNKIQDGIDAVTSSTVFVYSGIYYENVVVDKTVDLTWEDKNTTIIGGGGSGRDVVFISADWVNISGFTIRNSGIVWSGIDICSKYNTISGNTISNNFFGVSASHSNNTISNNNISMNTCIGIWIYSPSEYNAILNNTISFNNGNRGIILQYSSNNLIYNNYFNNTNNAYDDGNNIWNIAPTPGLNIIGGDWLGGNQWDDYTGIDIDGNDLDDAPYDIDGGANQDLYLLVYPEW